jgi:hypothetical protein
MLRCAIPRQAVAMQAGDKLKGKANEAGRKAQNAVGNTSQLPSPQDVRAAATVEGAFQFRSALCCLWTWVHSLQELARCCGRAWCFGPQHAEWLLACRATWGVV